MAYIRKHKDKWRAEVQRHGHRATHVADTKREAQAWALKKEAELDALQGSKGRTFQDAIDDYLRTVSPTKRNPEWEAKRFAAFAEHFGADTKLTSITTVEIGKWRDLRLKGTQEAKAVVGATVLRDANLLRNLFTIAREEWRWIDHNPFRGVRLPEQSEARHQVWGWRQIRRVLRAGREGKTGEVVRAFHIALHTAMRLREVLEGEYDPQRRVMLLARTKTGGRREVPIPRRAAKLLPAKFTVDPNMASVLFSKLTRQLLIEDRTFHDARATALTMLARKMDVMTLARISGHKDISLLHRVYYRETAESIAKRI